MSRSEFRKQTALKGIYKKNYFTGNKKAPQTCGALLMLYSNRIKTIWGSISHPRPAYCFYKR
jgi:hypothetical protein